MTFVLSFLLAALANAACNDLSPNIKESVAQHTFKLIPRNTYAATLSEESARSLHQKSCLAGGLSTSDQMNCDLLKICTGDACKIEFGPFGSAFLLEKNGLLISAWHVVFPTHAAGLIFMQGSLSQLPYDEMKSRLAVLEPDFILLDQNDKIVFDTKQNPSRYAFWGNPLSTVYQTEGHKQHQPYGYFENAPDDYVAIDISSVKLGSNVGMGLPLTTLTKKEDLATQCLYAGGYQYHDGKFRHSSGKKETVKAMQSRDSFATPFQLNPFPMAVEKILEFDNTKILKMMGYSDGNIQKTMAKYDAETIRRSIVIVLATQPRHLRDQALETNPAVLFYDAKVLPGQSGGPIVDANGTVVGITTNSFLDKSIAIDGHFTSNGAAGFFLGSLTL